MKSSRTLDRSLAPSFLERIHNWRGKSPASRRHAIRSRLQSLWGNIFRVKISRGRALYSAYQPDSYYLSADHQEFEDLFKRFTERNRLNNGGDIPRLWALMLNCKQILAENIAGDFAELGVWKGNTAAVLAYYAERSNRNIYLFDTYEGFSHEDLRGIDADKNMAFADTSIDLVREVVGARQANCVYVKGRFPESIEPQQRTRQYALVNLDCDLYEPMKAGLEFFYPRMPRGGVFFLHDYSSLQWDGSKRAIDDFCERTGEFIVLMPDKSGSAFLRKAR